ncbi:transposase [Gemmatimonas sp.]|uniref:transposase n=1 Tax=Gemmatimonas sp. TaxID=1962908 RepID=UPI0031F2F7EC
MPRMPRILLSGVPVHHLQRGNNRGPVFGDDRDRWLYRELLLEGCHRFGCGVHAYVLMSNHVHLLMTPQRADAIPQLTQWMGRKYVRAYNARHDRTGTLWEGRFRSSVIDSARYFLACSRYIDQNPVRAGIVREPAAYRWSSFARLAHGARDDLITEHPEYHSLGHSPAERQVAYRALCAPLVDPDVAGGIRLAVRRGDVLGSAAFADEVRARLGRPISRLAHGGNRRREPFDLRVS